MKHPDRHLAWRHFIQANKPMILVHPGWCSIRINSGRQPVFIDEKLTLYGFKRHFDLSNNVYWSRTTSSREEAEKIVRKLE